MGLEWDFLAFKIVRWRQPATKRHVSTRRDARYKDQGQRFEVAKANQLSAFLLTGATKFNRNRINADSF